MRVCVFFNLTISPKSLYFSKDTPNVYLDLFLQ